MCLEGEDLRCKCLPGTLCKRRRAEEGKSLALFRSPAKDGRLANNCWVRNVGAASEPAQESQIELL